MENLSLEKAIEILLEHCQKVEAVVELPVMDALGMVVAEDVTAPIDNPPFNRSPLDGYTFRSADTINAIQEKPAVFNIIAEECAGHFYAGRVNHGEAVRIMTGAAIPADCDCVIRQEDVIIDDNGKLLVLYTMKAYENFCEAGEDYKAGTVLIEKGTELTAAYLGVLASMGYARVKVYRRAKAVIASTGDELLSPGEPLTAGKIYNSNQYVLFGRLKEMGIDVEILSHLPDDEAGAAEALSAYKGKVDIIITTGGVSVGKMDIMHGVIPKMGAKRLFWRVAMKPGSPALAYDLDGTLGIALSGNPFAAFATFELMARPVLAEISRKKSLLPKTVKVVLANDFPKKSKGRRIIRAKIIEGRAYLPENHRSGALASSAACNAFVDIPAGSDVLKSGTEVKAIMLY